MNEDFHTLTLLYKELEDNVTFIKSLDFSVRIVNLCKFLREKKGETIMSKQILRSGTSIGANISEALAAESKDDFIHKFHISLKEGNETKYWLTLLFRCDYLSKEQYNSLIVDCEELIKLLTSIINKINNNQD